MDDHSGMLQEVEPFKVVLQTPEYSPICDIQMAKVKDVYLILAISETKLYQFTGMESIDSTLQMY